VGLASALRRAIALTSASRREHFAAGAENVSQWPQRAAGKAVHPRPTALDDSTERHATALADYVHGSSPGNAEAPSRETRGFLTREDQSRVASMCGLQRPMRGGGVRVPALPAPCAAVAGAVLGSVVSTAVVVRVSEVPVFVWVDGLLAPGAEDLPSCDEWCPPCSELAVCPAVVGHGSGWGAGERDPLVNELVEPEHVGVGLVVDGVSCPFVADEDGLDAQVGFDFGEGAGGGLGHAVTSADDPQDEV
jgi:hypothetical protein